LPAFRVAATTQASPKGRVGMFIVSVLAEISRTLTNSPRPSIVPTALPDSHLGIPPGCNCTPYTSLSKTGFGTGVIWSAVIPAKAGIHAETMALPLCTGPSGLELLGSNESNLPLDSRFRGNDCLHRPARKINFPKMTPLPKSGLVRHRD
jgi:hypothetical protein